MRIPAIFRITTLISALIILAATILLVINWPQIPDQVPTHFGFNGEADAYGGKGTLIFMDILAWGLLIGMTVISKYPNKMNYPVKVTEENKNRLYFLGIIMLEITKFFTGILFALIIICISLSANIPQAIVIINLAALLISIGICMYLMYKYK